MWELDCEESWAVKNWCFWTVVLEKTLESALDCKEIQPVHPKGDQSWVFIGRTDVEAETPVLWSPDPKSWLIGKDPDAGKDWRQEEKGMTEDEMAGWHHRHNGHGFGWTPGVGDGREAWHAMVHGVAKNWTRLSDCTELNRVRRDYSFMWWSSWTSKWLNDLIVVTLRMDDRLKFDCPHSHIIIPHCFNLFPQLYVILVGGRLCEDKWYFKGDVWIFTYSQSSISFWL